MGKDKEKITYIDDGRTIADMSEVRGSIPVSKNHTHASAKEQWQTYWTATKMMFVPTLIAVGFIVVAFLIVWIIFYLA